MIDIHCHILSHLDDGAKNMDESIAMAKIAVADGIKHIIATPHFTTDWMNKRPVVERKVKQLQQKLNEEGIALRIHVGNEVRMESKEFIYHHAKQDQFAYLDKDKRFVLLEQSWGNYNPDTPEVVKWLADRGTTAILPHPERHTFFRKQPHLIEQLIEAGMWTQITADSLTGNNGAEIERFAHWLAEKDMIHTIATDAHNVRRKPQMSQGFEVIRQLAGDQRVDQIKAQMNRILSL